MAKITDSERIIFYEQQKAGMLKNGLVTVYENYLSGEFFQRFFQDIKTHHAYALKVHLMSLNTGGRLSFDYVNNSGEIQAQLVYSAKSLSSSLEVLNLDLSQIISKKFHIANGRLISHEIFHIANRQILEDFLLFLQRDCMNDQSKQFLLGEPDNRLAELAISNLQSAIKKCKHLGLSSSKICELVINTDL
jgi:hypothetical protein